MAHDHWMPHGFCFLWDPAVLWPWVLGNALVALCYALIPVMLLWLRQARPDMIPAWVSWSFAAFIACCGAGHVMKIYTLWEPVYLVSAQLDVLTGVVSVPAGFGLASVIRRVRHHQVVQMQLRELAAEIRAVSETPAEGAHALRRATVLLDQMLEGGPR